MTDRDPIQALFGDNPQTDLPDPLEGWTPDPELTKVLSDMGYPTFESFMKDTITKMAQEDAHFDEIVSAATQSRQARTSAETRRLNQNKN